MALSDNVICGALQAYFTTALVRPDRCQPAWQFFALYQPMKPRRMNQVSVSA